LIRAESAATLAAVANNGDKTDKILHGIQLVLEEIRDLKEESRKDREESRKERREIAAMFQKAMEQAAEDRKQWAEDRKQAAEQQPRLILTLANIGDAVTALGTSNTALAKTTAVNTELLKQILKALQKNNGK